MTEHPIPADSTTEGFLPKSRFYRPETLYGMVAREISEAILSGRWQRGSTIPGEHEIAAQYGISVGTVRRALASLVSAGFLERRPRHGTVVVDRSPHHSLRFLFHYYRLHGTDGSLLESVPRTLSAKRVPPTDAERKALNLTGEDAEVIRIHRTRTVLDEPAAHDTMTLPAERYPDFPDIEQLPHRILSLLEEHYGVRFALVRENIWADSANEEDARLLGVEIGSPLLVVEHVGFDKAHEPVEMMVSRHLTRNNRYINEIR